MISFKLETDKDVLDCKVRNSFNLYDMDMVIDNQVYI